MKEFILINSKLFNISTILSIKKGEIKKQLSLKTYYVIQFNFKKKSEYLIYTSEYDRNNYFKELTKKISINI